MFKSFVKRLIFKLPFSDKFLKNSFGFDKYDRNGAYHWRELNKKTNYRNKANLIRQVLVDKNNPTVLDVGCGDGAIADYIADVSELVVGIDPESTAIKFAKELCKKRNVSFYNCSMTDYENLLKPLIKFDVIFALDVIEHLPKPEELLSFAINNLKKNGILIVGTPLFISKKLMSKYHWMEFEVGQIRNLIEKSFNEYEESFLPEIRKDGKEHKNNYYFAICYNGKINQPC